MSKNKRTTIGKIVFLIVLAGLTYYALHDTLPQIMGELFKTSGLTMLLLCLCAIVYQCLDGAAITVLAKKYNSDFRYRHGVGCSYYAAFFKTVTMGSGDLFASMYYYTEHGIPPEKNYGMITVFYVVQKITMTLYCVTCLLCNYHYMSGSYGQYMRYFLLGIQLTAVVAAVLLFVCISDRFHTFLIFLTNRVIRKEEWKKKLAEQTAKLKDVRIETIQLVKDKKLLLTLLGLNILKLTAWYFVPVAVFGREAIGISAFSIISIIAAAVALAGVMPTPAGIGSTEFVYILLFTPMLGDVKAASSVLLYRFATFLLPALIGSVYFLSTWIQKRQKAEDKL